METATSRTADPSDMSGDAWAFVASDLTVMKHEAQHCNRSGTRLRGSTDYSNSGNAVTIVLAAMFTLIAGARHHSRFAR